MLLGTALNVEETKCNCWFFPYLVCVGPCRDYVNKWSSKGVQVVGWTVNRFAEKMYYENVLQATYITDSMLEDCDPHY